MAVGLTVGDIDARLTRRVEQRLGARKFSMWFDQTARFTYLPDGHAVRLSVPTEYNAQRIRQHYLSDVASAAEQELGRPVRVELHVDGEAFAASSSLSEPGEMVRPGSAVSGHETREQERPRRTSSSGQTFSDRPAGYALASQSLRHRLDQFIVGPSNQLAYACAARMVGGEDLDPLLTDRHGNTTPPALFASAMAPVLFLHGGCGLGKTHLLQGICRAVVEHDPSAKILYTTGEQFTNRFIQAVRSNTLPAFRRRVRGLDLLAVDDVHFIASKEKTQQEFLHCFNEIELGGARVVMASDSHPKVIHSFSEALISRCMRGLVVQVYEPDLETRRTLIRKLAMRRGLVLQPQAAERLAQRTVDSVRDIEGSLTKLQALALMERSRYTERNGSSSGEAARPVLGLPSRLTAPVGHALVDRLFEEQAAVRTVKPVRFERMMDCVCEHLMVDREKLLGAADIGTSCWLGPC